MYVEKTQGYNYVYSRRRGNVEQSQ